MWWRQWINDKLVILVKTLGFPFGDGLGDCLLVHVEWEVDSLFTARGPAMAKNGVSGETADFRPVKEAKISSYPQV